MPKNIIIKSKCIIDNKTDELKLLEILLKNRNISKKVIHEFLKPTFPQKLIPKDFGVNKKQLEKAVKRIRKAIDNQENILIYGDYDVDGISSTAVLWQSLNKAGAKVTPFIPDRNNDGYGLKSQSFLNFQEEKKVKFSLLITVDNGIVAHPEIEKIQKKGTDVIITDHHLPTETIPSVTALIHSTSVSGCTLAWFLASQFDKDADLGLAALGAVADCVPLVGINRNIVTHGLISLRLNPSSGIKKLISISGSKQDSLSTYDLGFLLGPRINAVGRLSNPTDALRLLCSQNAVQAGKYAQVLDSYNKDRQMLQQDSLDLAENSIKKIKDKLIFIADKTFHPGIIGLIAGRLTEKYYLPSIAVSIGDGISKGSCRSIKELNIIESLREFSDLFVDLGGHAGAAGFSIKNSNIKKLKEVLIKNVNKKLNNLNLESTIVVDAQMKLNSVTIKNYKVIQKMEPFGINNQEPLFLFKDLKVVQKKLVGSTGNHLKLKLDDLKTPQKENLIADAIAFKKGDMDSQIKIGDTVDIVASLSSNTWQNITTPQLIVKEIFPKNSSV